MTHLTDTADDRLLLLQMIEEAFRMPNWNETSLNSTLRRVTPEMASWRPRHSKHSIADIVLHCAYWKYAMRRRLTGTSRGSFPLKGSNWFKTPSRLTKDLWLEYREMLEYQHQQLAGAIESTRRKLSHGKARRVGKWTSVQQIYWLAIHDGYHTGQINLIKAMYRSAKK